MAELVIHAKVDDVMRRLMEKLEMEIPKFRRHYRLKVSLNEGENGVKNLNMEGVDSDGKCFTIFKSLTVHGLNAAGSSTYPKDNNLK